MPRYYPPLRLHSALTELEVGRDPRRACWVAVMADDEDPEPVEETYESLRDLLYRVRYDADIDDETLTVLLDDRDRAWTAARAGRGARAGAGR